MMKKFTTFDAEGDQNLNFLRSSNLPFSFNPDTRIWCSCFTLSSGTLALVCKLPKVERKIYLA